MQSPKQVGTGPVLDCQLLQQEEWEVLESIYPDFVSGDPSYGRIKLEVPIELPEASVIVSSDPVTKQANGPADERPQSPLLSILPPILLELLLPATYPLSDPPQILSLYATYAWLPVTSTLQRLLLEKWIEGESVLYTWVEWLRSGEFLESMGLLGHDHDRPVVRIPYNDIRFLIPMLVAHETSAQNARFSQNSYNCEVCLTSIKGARCILLSCSHVFCRGCLEDFWSLCIKEGDVSRVGCPDPACIKEGREAEEAEIRRVVSEEEVGRWKWLREKRILDKDPTITHCPVPFCQHPVPKPGNVEPDSGWARLRTCLKCEYSFCAFCKHGWHGPISECPLVATESFVLEYMTLKGTAEREAMEQRYGKARLAKLVKLYEDDKATKEWLSGQTTTCPRCEVHVEKSMGCNHMTCARCNQHFCFRCGQKLDALQPYKHFSTPGLYCFNRLFDRDPEEDGWVPMFRDI